MPHEIKQTRILVVEDDPMVLELITTRLSLAGFHTFNARDGYEGLARLKEVSPAAMVLDINMPRLDGFGVLKGMKALGIAVPTLVLTARNQRSDVQEALKLGASDFLAKPFQDQQLLARVGRLIRKPVPRPPPGDAAPAVII
ncbi:response regulator [Phenylobacterium sp.]|uniref:response regulator transcription factor n=1 Tax=Phenylobacterium sp. TaxID=1871053 RepID=UPI0030F3BA5D